MSTTICQRLGCTSTPVPQSIGITTIGATPDSGDSGSINALRVTTPALDGVLSTCSVYVQAPLDSLAANRQFQIGVYTDTAGHPDTLLAASGSGALVANSWNTITMPLVPLAPSTAFWIGYNTAGRTTGVNNVPIEIGAEALQRGTYAPAPFGTWPSPFDWSHNTGAGMSIYCTLLPR